MLGEKNHIASGFDVLIHGGITTAIGSDEGATDPLLIVLT